MGRLHTAAESSIEDHFGISSILVEGLVSSKIKIMISQICFLDVI